MQVQMLLQQLQHHIHDSTKPVQADTLTIMRQQNGAGETNAFIGEASFGLYNIANVFQPDVAVPCDVSIFVVAKPIAPTVGPVAVDVAHFMEQYMRINTTKIVFSSDALKMDDAQRSLCTRINERHNNRHNTTPAVRSKRPVGIR